MPTADAFLFDAGWLFFAAWSVVVIAVCLAAFGRDLFPATLWWFEPEQQDIPAPDAGHTPQTRLR